MKHQHHHDDDHFGPRRERGGGERHHHRGGRGGGPGRFFESGDLRFVILHLINDAPRHGYEIIRLIEDLLAGANAPSPGIVYPTLTLLEEMGLAIAKVEGNRKLYSITQDGQHVLESKRALTDAILQRMKQAGQQHAQERPPQIMRAMENLKMVLRMRTAGFSPDQIAAATDAIDNAARQVERL